MQLLLIRHGHPEQHVVDEGTADPPLDARGRDEARALAEWLADEPIDALYTSPLRRARETARPLEEATGLVATVCDDVAEWDRDAKIYLPTEDLRVAAPDIWEALTNDDWTALGIDLPAFLHRVVHGLDSIASAHPSEVVAVVCHGGVINAYLARLLGLERILFFDPAYTGLSRVLVARSGERSIASVNETAHLRTLQR